MSMGPKNSSTVVWTIRSVSFTSVRQRLPNLTTEKDTYGGVSLCDCKDFYYGWTKAQAEERILRAVREAGLDGVILRPTALIGPPDAQPSRFGRTILDLYNGNLPLISSGGYDLIDIRDFLKR